jgi:hypothetical protein
MSEQQNDPPPARRQDLEPGGTLASSAGRSAGWLTRTSNLTPYARADADAAHSGCS